MKSLLQSVGFLMFILIITGCDLNGDKKSKPLPSKDVVVGEDLTGEGITSAGDVSVLDPASFTYETGTEVSVADLPAGKYLLSRIIVNDVRKIEDKQITSVIDYQLNVPGQLVASGDTRDLVKGHTDIDDETAIKGLPNATLNVPQSIEVTSGKISAQEEVMWDAIIGQNNLVTVSIESSKDGIATVSNFFGVSETSPGLIMHPSFGNLEMSVQLLNEAPVFIVSHSDDNGQYVNYTLFYSKAESE